MVEKNRFTLIVYSFPLHFIADRTLSMRPDQQGYRSNAPFDDSTTNKTDYKRWEVQPLQTHRPDEYRANTGEMDLNTIYNSEFTPKPMTKAQPIKPIERRGAGAKFDDSTTYNGDYRQWPGGRPPTMRAQAGYQPPSMPFEGMSTYKGKKIKISRKSYAFDTKNNC